MRQSRRRSRFLGSNRLGVVAGLLLPLSLAFPTSGATAAGCLNEAARSGLSERLPDCRAYEVVTPDTNGTPPVSLVGAEVSDPFDTWMASPAGDSLIFDANNGAIGGSRGNGKSDQYLSTRTVNGWTTSSVGPTGAESGGPAVGGTAANHGSSFWYVYEGGGGALATSTPHNFATYTRDPDGVFNPTGSGSLGIDREAFGLWISPDSDHEIFRSTVTESLHGKESIPLEPAAAPSPLVSIYDRTPSSTSVASLLPNDVTPSSSARYVGASADGTGAFFELNGMTFERRDAKTQLMEAAHPQTRLNCSSPEVSGGGNSYNWLQNGTPIPEATEQAYVVTGADAGTNLQCQITVSGSTTSISTPPTEVAPVPSEPFEMLKAPTASGPPSPSAGSVVTCESGQWTGSPVFEYQWFANGAEVPGATSETLTLTGSEVPAALQCEIFASAGGQRLVAVSSVLATNPAPPGPPKKPIVEVGGALVAGTGGQTQSTASIFAGSSSDGSRSFAVSGGGISGGFKELWAFNWASGAHTLVADEGAIWVTNVSEDGSHVFFISSAVLTGGEEGPSGAVAQAGERNLYTWDEGLTQFIATVGAADVFGFPGNAIGLGAWVSGFGPEVGAQVGPATDPSRSTPNGNVLVFQSQANLLPSYDSEGKSEIFRYDEDADTLECVSCNSSATPTSGAWLESVNNGLVESPTTALTHIPNVSPDGSAVFFQTPESLLEADKNSTWDVYEWSEQGLSLISSGESAEPSFLFGMSADASDVFFTTYATLAEQDEDGGGPSIYDARIDGGFAPAVAPPECDEEACLPPLSPSPILLSAITAQAQPEGNFVPGKPKPKKHKHRKQKHHRKKKNKQRTGGHSSTARDLGTLKGRAGL